MSIEPCHMGGYASYFSPTQQQRLGKAYSVQLTGYSGWAEAAMPLKRFCQIRSAFHPEFGVSSVGNKCHQLRYLIRNINHAAARTYNVGKNVTFDEGVIATRTRFCCVRQYNKDKPDKF